MYLKDGREIYESSKFPGYFIDANTGAFCDEEGNYIGGNIDNGDEPGGSMVASMNREIAFVTRTGKLYYPKRTKSASIAMTLAEAQKKHYRPSPGYISFQSKRHKKQKRK